MTKAVDNFFLTSPFGRHENDYSRNLAQALEVLPGFRKSVFEIISKHLRIQGNTRLADHLDRFIGPTAPIPVIRTEFAFARGRIDLHVHYAGEHGSPKRPWNGLFIGVENKIEQNLTGDQLRRYEDTYAEFEGFFGHAFIVVWLRPSRHSQVGAIRGNPGSFVELSYDDLISALAFVPTPDSSEDKITYCKVLAEYFQRAEIGCQGSPENFGRWSVSDKERLLRFIGELNELNTLKKSSNHFFDWHYGGTRRQPSKTWQRFYETPRMAGFIYHSFSILMGAAFEEMFSEPDQPAVINSFEDLDEFYRRHMVRHPIGEERAFFYIADHIMMRINDEQFCRRARNLARRLKGQNLTDAQQTSFEKQRRKRIPPPFFDETYRTELGPEYDDEM